MHWNFLARFSQKYMAKENICFLTSNASRTLKIAKMAKISYIWQPCSGVKCNKFRFIASQRNYHAFVLAFLSNSHKAITTRASLKFKLQ